MRKFKTILVILLIICILPVLSYAKASEKKYISKNEAKLIAINHMKNRITIDKECPWKGKIKISETITLYDLKEQPNAYVFNLQMDNEEKGFILVEANVQAPDVQEFAYSGEFSVNTKSDGHDIKRELSTNFLKDKIYYLGGHTFVLKSENPNKFYDLTAQNEVERNKNDILEQYKEKYLGKKDNNSVQTLNKLVTDKQMIELVANNDTIDFSNTITTTSVTISEKHDLPNLTSISLFTQSGDPYANGPHGLDPTWSYDVNCGPTAGTTMIGYWVNQKGKYGLYNSSWRWIHNSLYSTMKTIPTGVAPGTSPMNFYNGLISYGTSVRGIAPTGSDYSYSPTFSRAEDIIEAGVPFSVFVDHWAGSGSAHAVVVLGTERSSAGDYLRISPGQGGYCNCAPDYNEYQYWYKWDSNIYFYAYARWN